jgi:hypothetical protein
LGLVGEGIGGGGGGGAGFFCGAGAGAGAGGGFGVVSFFSIRFGGLPTKQKHHMSHWYTHIHDVSDVQTARIPSKRSYVSSSSPCCFSAAGVLITEAERKGKSFQKVSTRTKHHTNVPAFKEVLAAEGALGAVARECIVLGDGLAMLAARSARNRMTSSSMSGFPGCPDVEEDWPSKAEAAWLSI